MRARHRRLAAIGAGLVGLAVCVALVLVALEENIVLFFSPSEVATMEIEEGRRLRVGGLVEEGSMAQSDALHLAFRITDGAEVVNVQYEGILPDLFREGQGVVVEGKFDGDGVFVASEVLAKHDENYMPPEVADALQKTGHWKETVEQ
jgi:cytochrome c-type biogenesis protein CcmE